MSYNPGSSAALETRARIVEVREMTVPLRSEARNAVVAFGDMTVSVVALFSDAVRAGRRVVGFAFSGIGRYAQGGIIRERLIPRVTGVGATPHEVRAAAMRNEKPGGHGDRSVALAAVELASWDLAAKLEGVPVHALIARRGTSESSADAAPRPGERARVAVYAAGGYYHDGGTEVLVDEMTRHLDAGFTHVKMKVGGAPLAEDVERVESVLRLVPDGSHLAVDANGRLDADTASAYVDALTPFGLRWFEEPGDPIDFDLLAALVADGRMTYATGENLFAIEEVRNLIRYGGLRPERDIVEVDPALACGILEYAHVVAALDAAGWPRQGIVPHGGHLISLHVAAGYGLGGCEAYPREFAPFGGFGPATSVEDGIATLPDAPGFGLETKPDLAPVLERLVA